LPDLLTKETKIDFLVYPLHPAIAEALNGR
jgi:hypothetical protein